MNKHQAKFRHKIASYIAFATIVVISALTAEQIIAPLSGALAANPAPVTMNVTVRNALAAPTNLVTAIDNNTANITWTATVTPETDGYYLRWKKTDADTWLQVTVTPPTLEAYSLTSLEHGTYNLYLVTVLGSEESSRTETTFTIASPAPSDQPVVVANNTGGASHGGVEIIAADATEDQGLLMIPSGKTDEKIMIVTNPTFQANPGQIVDTEDENDLEDTVEIDVRPIVDVKENSSVTGKQQFFYGFTDPESTVTLMARNSQGQKILIGTAKSRADGLYVLDRLSNLPAGTYDIITRTTDWEEVTQNVTISKTEDNGKIAIQNFADVNFKELTKIAEQNKADIFKNGHINLERIKIVTDNPRPELTGRLDMNKYESVKYLSGVAVWRSRTLVSKLTFNDDGTFTTKPPVDLPDGEHQVSFYIRDESTREDSKSQITFAVISKKEALANAEDKAKASYRVADVFNAIENAPAYWLLVLLIPFVGYFAYSFGQRRNKRLVERYKDVSEARGKNASETNG